MPDTILLEFYEQRPTRFSSFPERVKVAELDVAQLTVTELEEVIEIQEMLGRTFHIKRIAV